MSEKKRAELIPIVQDKRQRSDVKTVRLSFKLPESNESTCAVYNYKEELALAKKKDKTKPVNNGKPTNGLDPFDEDDDDVRRLAQEMEAKYGTSSQPKHRRKGRRDDYADIGMGYDESDSFIDNTHGYDEMIPQNVTTLHGGFYINCGALEFKTDDEVSSEISSSSESSSSDDERGGGGNRKPSRKRVLESSDSEGETKTDKNHHHNKENDGGRSHAEKKQRLSNGMATGVKRKKLLTPDKIKQLKKVGTSAASSSSDDGRKKSVKELLKEKREEGVVSTGGPADVPTVTDKDVTVKENKKPPSVNSVTDIIESVAKGTDNNNVIDVDAKDVIVETVKKEVTIVPLTSNPIKPDLSTENSMEGSVAGEPKQEIVQLPENLTESILEIVNKLKDTALKNIEGGGKVFSPSVNGLLLSLERKCRCLGKLSRTKIYQHLGPFMNCRKETLIRRAKNLVLEDDMKKLAELVVELKSKIDAAMVPLLEIYEKESQKIVQKKFSRETLEQEENKQLRMPKRKFVWPEDVKKMFKDIVMIRRRCYVNEGKAKEDVDIQMNIYLKSEIQILWPDGWMSMNALLKVYSSFCEKKSPVNPDYPKLPPKELAKSNLSKLQPPQNCLAPGVKEIQKLATNSMLSITPVSLPKPSETPPPAPPQKSDLTINVIDGVPPSIEISRNSGITISPRSRDDKPKPPTPDDKPSDHKTEKSTTFINLPQNSYTTVRPENLTLKPTKPPTDHKIENIIKPSSARPENLVKPKPVVELLPENLSKPKPAEKTDVASSKPENLTKPKTEKPAEPCKPERSNSTDDVIILDDNPEPPRKERAKANEQVIDLTSMPVEVKRKPGPKCKTKYFDTSLIKPIKNALALEELKLKASGGNNILENILQDNLVDAEHYYGMKKPSRSEAKDPRVLAKASDGDDIQKVMEDLKVLQKMSTPAKTNSDSLTSSPVSVIAFNKSYTPKTSGTPPATTSASVSSSSSSAAAAAKGGGGFGLGFQEVFQKTYAAQKVNTPVSTAQKVDAKSDYTLGFQEAFQRQFLSDFRNSIGSGGGQSLPASSKSYSSGHGSSSHQDKHYTNANNNYAQQSANKYKSNYTNQQPGTYNLMDDMLANFMTEYAYPKTAGQKQKQPPPQK